MFSTLAYKVNDCKLVQPIKADAPIDFAEILAVERDVHPEKAPLPMLNTLLGTVTLKSELQSENALGWILVTPPDIDTLAREIHLENVYVPNSFTCGGIDILESELQLANALVPILVTLFGIDTLLRAGQVANAPDDISSMPFSMMTDWRVDDLHSSILTTVKVRMEEPEIYSTVEGMVIWVADVLRKRLIYAVLLLPFKTSYQKFVSRNPSPNAVSVANSMMRGNNKQRNSAVFFKLVHFIFTTSSFLLHVRRQTIQCIKGAHSPSDALTRSPATGIFRIHEGEMRPIGRISTYMPFGIEIVAVLRVNDV